MNAPDKSAGFSASHRSLCQRCWLLSVREWKKGIRGSGSRAGSLREGLRVLQLMVYRV